MWTVKTDGTGGVWICSPDGTHVAKVNDTLSPPGAASVEQGSGPLQWGREVVRLINQGIGMTFAGQKAIAEAEECSTS